MEDQEVLNLQEVEEGELWGTPPQPRLMMDRTDLEGRRRMLCCQSLAAREEAVVDSLAEVVRASWQVLRVEAEVALATLVVS